MDKFKACVKVKLKENKVAIMYSIVFFSSIEMDNSLTYTFDAHKCLKTSS